MSPARPPGLKVPKVYFLDVGTLAYLVGVRTVEHARMGPMAGALFETAVVSDLLRSLWHAGTNPRAYFWRTATGQEVDLLIETDRSLIPIEIKASATVVPAMADGIRRLRADLGDRIGEGAVVFGGTSPIPLGPLVRAIPFASL